MSVEVRHGAGGGAECDWGPIELSAHGGPPAEPKPLLLLDADEIDRMVRAGADCPHECGAVTTVKERQPEPAGEVVLGCDVVPHRSGLVIATPLKTRKFLTLTRGRETWTWELYEAHWAPDDFDEGRIYVGRWPD
ncbi:hypothetical protein [Mycobacterium sp. 1465703.0]|uniref:hypothetical protein n=1 Tax=Mycobacterium sp. 1465703.0 TaxID=1834078 RepID=UPI000A9CFE69|nr:hypothetical protein [Mycobacterium sp. 1465703.0]